MNDIFKKLQELQIEIAKNKELEMQKVAQKNQMSKPNSSVMSENYPELINKFGNFDMFDPKLKEQIERSKYIENTNKIKFPIEEENRTQILKKLLNK